jgi:hypothetical protein
MAANNRPDDEEHLSQERLRELLENVGRDISNDEWTHLADCNECRSRFLSQLKK